MTCITFKLDLADDGRIFTTGTCRNRPCKDRSESSANRKNRSDSQIVVHPIDQKIPVPPFLITQEMMPFGLSENWKGSCTH